MKEKNKELIKIYTFSRWSVCVGGGGNALLWLLDYLLHVQ